MSMLKISMLEINVDKNEQKWLRIAIDMGRRWMGEESSLNTYEFILTIGEPQLICKCKIYGK